MPRLAIDVMGGDHGVSPLVLGAISALKVSQNLHIVLVGDSSQINPCLTNDYQDRLSVLHAPEVVDMQDNPLSVLRAKPDASMAMAIDLAIDSKVDGVVSAGNTGALVSFGVKKAGMREGYSRPAICTQVPNVKGRTWLLDLGATLSASDDRLVELAKLGADQCRTYSQIDKPRVGLLNVGVEQGKGTDELQKAAERLRDEQGLKYSGYVEGGCIFSEAVDVVVCDGFSGNIAIKTAEGVSKLLREKFADPSTLTWYGKLALWIASKAMRKAGSEVDPALFNGAPLLGLNKLIIKSHGNADARGFENAVLLADKLATKLAV